MKKTGVGLSTRWEELRVILGKSAKMIRNDRGSKTRRIEWIKEIKSFIIRQYQAHSPDINFHSISYCILCKSSFLINRSSSISIHQKWRMTFQAERSNADIMCKMQNESCGS